MSKCGTITKKNAMIKALTSSLGVIKPALDMVGLSRNTHDDWMRNDPEYRARVEEVYEIDLDFGENALRKAMKNGSVPAIIFYLKTKGKKRGYQESSTVDTTVHIAPAENIDAVIERLGGADKAREILGGAIGNNG